MGLSCSKARHDKLQDFVKQIPLIKQLVEEIESANNFLYDKSSPVQITPLLKSNCQKGNIYLKMESFQPSGSFKLRGAYYKIAKLMKKQNKIMIIVASTGNHALACEYVAQLYNKNIEPQQQQKVQVNHQAEYSTPTPQDSSSLLIQDDSKLNVHMTVLVPKNINPMKMSHLSSQIIHSGCDMQETEAKARNYAEVHKQIYISPYNDIEIIAATASIGRELYSQYFQQISIIQQRFTEKQKDIQYVFVSVGGGGLISGIAIQLKVVQNLSLKIIGVQPKLNACMYHSIKKGAIDNSVELLNTLSDGTEGGIEENAVTFEICKHLVDDWVLVSEEEIEQSLVHLVTSDKILVEGSAALAYAGCKQYIEKFDLFEANCAVIMCGANTELDFVQSMIKQRK